MTEKQRLHLERIHALKRGTKLSEETKRKISLGHIGKLKGRKRNPASVLKGALKRRRGAFFNCLLCNKEFWRSPSHIKRGDCKFCSRQCYLTNQIGKPKSEAFILFCKSRKGERAATWKGGITPESFKIRSSPEYKEWREKVFARDNWTCQECSARSEKGRPVYLEAHHIKAFATHVELRFDISNGQTLCKKCHSFKPKGTKIYEQHHAA